jgi:hypothetical protein
MGHEPPAGKTVDARIERLGFYSYGTCQSLKTLGKTP